MLLISLAGMQSCDPGRLGVPHLATVKVDGPSNLEALRAGQAVELDVSADAHIEHHREHGSQLWAQVDLKPIQAQRLRHGLQRRLSWLQFKAGQFYECLF